MAKTGLLRRQGLSDSMTVYGLRSSFPDWVSEQTATLWGVEEIALARRARSAAEQDYHRTDLLEQRRALMDEWAAFLAN